MSQDDDWELFDDDEDVVNDLPTDAPDYQEPEPEPEMEPEPVTEPEPDIILTDDDFDDDPEQEPEPVVISRKPRPVPAQVVPAEPPKKGFFDTLKDIFFTRKEKSTEPIAPARSTKKGLAKKVKTTRLGAWASKKEKEITTGLTTRQRIKRYNAIHEGDYGAPIPTPETDE